ncbi:hypothetical protein KGF57_004346 [Candida theae]|uniref:MAGE domain-containing protein n=1 Tax=Candida theae TaxID=1198502 RepID=A0AAD5BBW7_9ASCO|nr:uncharacterized protein KGF57_004346 [Candida theae]KAI5950383.1 hypothetical protein KGF57_004346 [Candida theae]
MPKRKIPLEDLDVVHSELHRASPDNNDDDDDDYEDDEPQPSSKRRQLQKRRSNEQNTQDDIDYLEGSNNSSSNNNNNVLGLHTEGDKAHDVNYVVKLILTKDARGQNFQKQHINQYLTNKRFKSDLLLDDAIAILENVYGLTLVDAPTIKQEKKFQADLSKKQAKDETRIDANDGNGKNVKKQPPKNRFFLTSNLSKPAQEVLGELWMKPIDKSLDMSKIGDTRFFLPRYGKSKLPKSNSELVKTGIMMLITTLVVLSENHIMESQLIRSLKRFGISESENFKNTNLNMNWKEILKELVSRDYLNQVPLDAKSSSTTTTTSSSSSSSDKIFAISLGKRSLIEFPPSSVYEYIKTLYGSEFNEVISSRTKVTLERAYGLDWNDEEEEEGAEEEDDGHGAKEGVQGEVGPE